MSFFKRMAQRARLNGDLDDELQAFADELTEQKIRQGMTSEDARRAARLEIGGIEQVKEACRDTWSFHGLDSLAADVRYGFRSLVKAPAFFLMVVATLGPGLGLNTALFSIFDAYFLHPLSVRDPQTLYEVVWLNRGRSTHVFDMSEVEALTKHQQVFTELLATQNLPTRVEGIPIYGQLVTGNYFNMLGIGVAKGRPLLPQDGAVLVLGYDAWKSRFGGDPEIIGRKIHLKGHPVEVIGIAQPGFTGLGNLTMEFWAPLQLAPTLFANDGKLDGRVSVTGRLRPGVSSEQAAAAIEVWATQRTANQSQPDHVMLVSQATKLSLKQEFKKPAPLFVAFGLILLMACANVSNMMLARALGRQREIGIRTSLGAPRMRLIRQLLTESLLLAIPASAVGLAFSAVALAAFRRAVVSTMPAEFAFFFRLPDWSLDFRVVTYVIMAGFGCALAFGLLPALQVTRADLTRASRGEFGIGSFRPSRLRNVLVVGQVTVCVLLLISTAIVLRSRQNMAGQNLGLQTSGVFDVHVPDRLRSGVAEQLRQAVPGVEEAAVWRFPLYGRLRTVAATPAGNAMTFPAGYNFVSPEYFTILKIPIVAGRNFTESEARAEGTSVIVSEATARLFWPNQNPLGQTLKIDKNASEDSNKQPAFTTATVVGIAGDVVSGIVGDGLDHTCLYFPTDLQAERVTLMVGTVAGPAALSLVKAAADRVSPDAAEAIMPMDDIVGVQLYPFRVTFWICSCLAALALFLAATGIYGVMAYLVNQRAQEFGIRMALGATPGDLIRTVLAESLCLTGWGTAIGISIAAAIAPVFAHQLAALNPFDGLPYAAGALVALGTALASAFFPSHRAARIDPAASLRSE